MANMVLPSLALLTGLSVAAAARAQTTEPILEATFVAAGLSQPSLICAPPGDTNRLFVLELPGRIRVVKNGVPLPTLFLDIQDKAEQGAQSGLLGMAFHPNYASNGWFYVYYAISGKSAMIERYTVSAGNPDVANPFTALPMLSGPIVDPVEFHMGGGMDFGPDGKLYVAVGDVRETPASTCASQRLDTLLGKVLRLNDNGTVPADNPFVGVPGARPEIWDLGLRAPFRLQFDVLSGDMYIGDIGETLREEIDRHPASTPGGMNFGWRVMEGELCTGAAQCAAYPCPSPNYTLPLFSYAHFNHTCCVLGSGVYRGGTVPNLQGAYLYGDYCTADVFTLRMQGGVVTENNKLQILMPPGGQIEELVQVAEVGGRLYLLDLAFGGTNQGAIWRVGLPSFTSLGGALGSPTFTGIGAAQAGQQIWLTLKNAQPAAKVFLIVGIGVMNLPFKGGVMVPAVDFILPGLYVNPVGTLTLPFEWPNGVPAGLSIVMQWWILDPSGPAGFTASNALETDTL
jgi:glucose/arabinose dehydrogenase